MRALNFRSPSNGRCKADPGKKLPQSDLRDIVEQKGATYKS